jgi:tetratricopeptide (TPR) repeat protein
MEAFDAALARDDRLERAWDGKAAAHLGRREDEAAAEAALRAVAVRADHAAAHYHLGVALMRLGGGGDAAVALRRAADLQPDLLAAHRRLVELYEGPLLDPAAAREQRLRAVGIALRRRGERERGAIGQQSAG